MEKKYVPPALMSIMEDKAKTVVIVALLVWLWVKVFDPKAVGV